MIAQLLSILLLGLAVSATSMPSDAREPANRQAGNRVPGSDELVQMRNEMFGFGAIVGTGSRREAQRISREQLDVLEQLLAAQREQSAVDRIDWLPVTEAAAAIYRNTWPDESTTAEQAVRNLERLYPAFESAADALESKLGARGL